MHTNSTPNYDLPQFLGTDQPDFVGDFNPAFLHIDTTMKANESAATKAESIANGANTKADSAVQTANNAIMQIGAVETKADNAVTTANNAQTGVSENKANISNINTTLNSNVWTRATTITLSEGISGTLYCSYNKFINLISFFGQINVTGGLTQGKIIGTIPTSIIKITNERTIRNMCFGRASTSGQQPAFFDLVINTSNQIVRQGSGTSLTVFSFQNMLNATEWIN